MNITEMKQQRAALVKQARALLDKAEQEKRDLTAEEVQQYDSIMADVDKLGAAISREERLQALELQLQQRTGALPPAVGATPEKRDEEYAAAFWKAMRRAVLDQAEQRALQVGTNSEGGYLVPQEYETTLVQALEAQNVMRGLATVITTAADRNIPVVATHGTASWLDEEAAYTESDETFGRVTIAAYKVGTLVKVSEELLNDSAFDLAAYLASEFGRRVGRTEEAACVNGDGVKKPAGLLGAAQVGVTAAAANAITVDEVLALYHSLARPYRQRATWLFADSTALALRKLKDTTGQYIWQPGLTAGEPDTLLGRPVAVSDDVPAIVANAISIAFGDLSYYWIADRQGRVMQRLNELYAANGQVGFRVYQRVDGRLILPEAVKVLKHPAA